MPWIRKVETTSKNPMNSTEWAMNYQNDLSARGKHQIVLLRLLAGARPVDYRRRKSRFNAAPSSSVTAENIFRRDDDEKYRPK